MANTINTQGAVTTISSIDEDYDAGDYLPVQSIRFNPAGADTCVIKNGSASGPPVFSVECAGSTDDKIQYYDGTLLQPFLDFSAGSFTAGAEVTIIYQRGRS